MNERFYFIGEDDYAAYALPDGLHVWNLGVGMTGVVTQGENGDVLIPTCIDQNPCAHLRCPMDMIVHG